MSTSSSLQIFAAIVIITLAIITSFIILWACHHLAMLPNPFASWHLRNLTILISLSLPTFTPQESVASSRASCITCVCIITSCCIFLCIVNFWSGRVKHSMAHRNGVSNFKFFVIFLLFWRQLDAGEVAQCQKADGQLEMDRSGIKIKVKRTLVSLLVTCPC